MDNFDLKRFLVENKMTRNSRLLNENQIPYDIEEFLNDMINSEVLEDLSDNVEEGNNVNGVWDIKEYGNEEEYGDAADDFKKAYQYIKDQGGQITIPGNPDVKYDALYDGSIGYSLYVTLNELAKLKWTPEKLEQEAAKYDTPKEFQQANRDAYQSYRIAVRKGLIQNKFEEQFRWTKDALEQEAAKYNTPGEFQKADVNAYIAYRTAVNNGLIQNKFEEQFRWTKDALEQEAAKYNTSSEFIKTDPNIYAAYRRAVNKGLIQNKFKPTKDTFNKYQPKGDIWSPEKLEQEADKYDTSKEFAQTDSRTYHAYQHAVNKGLISDKFKKTGFGNKWTKDNIEQEAAKYDKASEFIKANPRAYAIYRNAINKGLIQDKFKQ